ncbi:MAG: arginine--tRNA ligase, partial [Lachnospiraceae bacterium]|nr:arginine--tRNA ligase [Lachnospiraceae bacterium]
MKSIRKQIFEVTKEVFVRHGLDESLAHVSVSNRPDLCDYQCNGALAAAKQLHKPPISIAEELAAALSDCPLFEKVEAVKPGFINFSLSGDCLAESLSTMREQEKLGFEGADTPRTIILDYGGPNVAKPLHVGHLRSAIIGESLKRILSFTGERCIGDIHMGDWGLQMGLIVVELQERHPELVYFDEDFAGDYPKEPPFTISELEEIYPTASAKSKADEAYYKRALVATKEMQEGRRGYQALLSHIMQVSVADLKRNYDRLNVHFELWKGEADAAPYIPAMVEKMKADGYAYLSDGALVVDVAEEGDTKELPPCMILKSDGAALYDTTDLATLVWREEDYHPDSVIYIVDKRQQMHFTQVFRCAKKTGIVPKETELLFLGFGTMNGKDGKAFKTREGGVMRLEQLISDINETMLKKIRENDAIRGDEAERTAEIVGLAALKYGDLSN